MKTQTPKPRTGKNILLLAALTLAGTTIALPAAAHDRYKPMHNSGGGYNNGNNTGYNNNRYAMSPRQDYSWLNRINRYGVRGKIVKYGRGPLQGCFRVKRPGRFQGEKALVTVRYCLDNYGQAQVARGSKRLIKYLTYYRPAYRPANGYRNNRPMTHRY